MENGLMIYTKCIQAERWIFMVCPIMAINLNTSTNHVTRALTINEYDRMILNQLQEYQRSNIILRNM